MYSFIPFLMTFICLTAFAGGKKICEWTLSGRNLQSISWNNQKALRKARLDLFRLFHSHLDDIRSGHIPRPFELVRIPVDDLQKVGETLKIPGVTNNLNRFPGMVLKNAYFILNAKKVIGYAVVFSEAGGPPADILGELAENPLILNLSGRSTSADLLSNELLPGLAEAIGMDLKTFQSKVVVPFRKKEATQYRGMGVDPFIFMDPF